MRRGFAYISDLFLGHNFVKTFEDLVIEFDIPIRDRRKYNSLMNGIYLDWFQNPKNIQEDVFGKSLLLCWMKTKSRNMLIPFWSTEYKIAESKGKLSLHFKKWSLDLEAS